MDEYDFANLRRAQRVDVFCDLVDKVADKDKTFAITQHGKPVAMVVNVDTYNEMLDALVLGRVR